MLTRSFDAGGFRIRAVVFDNDSISLLPVVVGRESISYVRIPIYIITVNKLPYRTVIYTGIGRLNLDNLPIRLFPFCKAKKVDRFRVS